MNRGIQRPSKKRMQDAELKFLKNTVCSAMDLRGKGMDREPPVPGRMLTRRCPSLRLRDGPHDRWSPHYWLLADRSGIRAAHPGSVTELSTLVEPPTILGSVNSEATRERSTGVDRSEPEAPRDGGRSASALRRSISELPVHVLSPAVSRPVGNEGTGVPGSGGSTAHTQ